MKQLFSFKKILLSFFFLPILLFILFTLPAKASAFILSGKVTDNTGAVISGTSKIDVFNTGTTTDAVPPTTTDSSGNYSFTNLSSGTYDIQVTPPSGSGFGSAIALRKNITVDTVLNFVLVPTSSFISISGRVVDSSGNGISGVSISASSPNNFIPGGATSDSTGHYTISHLSPGSGFILSFGYPNTAGQGRVNYSTQSSGCSQSFSQNTTLNDVVLPAFHGITVHIQDSTGIAVANANLAIQSTNIPSLQIGMCAAPGDAGVGSSFPNPPTLLTDTNGNVPVQLVPGSYGFTATPQSGNSGPASINSSIDFTTTIVTITVPRLISISGRFIDSSGSGVSGVSIRATSSPNNFVGQSAISDSNGNYVISHLTPDSNFMFNVNYVSTTGQGRVSWSGGCGQSFSQDTTLSDITLSSFQSVVVHVQDNTGTAVANTNIQAQSTNIPSLQIGVCTISGQEGLGTPINFPTADTITTNANGDISLQLVSGSYGITATPHGSNYGSSSLNTTVGANTSLIIITVPHFISISGRVVDSSGFGVSGVSLNISSPNNFAGHSAITDNLGHYIILNITPDSGFTFNLGYPSPTGKARASYSTNGCNEAFSQDTTLNDITLPLFQLVTVHVQDTNGVAVPNTNIQGQSTNIPSVQIGTCAALGQEGVGAPANFPSSNTLTTNANGDVIAIELVPGTYGFNATPPVSTNLVPFSVNFTVSSSQTEIVSLQFANQPPTANAGGPYSIAEGGSLPLQGSGTDPDGDQLTYSWDLTGGTNFTTSGQNPIFQAGINDGGTSQQVNLQVCDSKGACVTSLATVNIFSVAPVLGQITAPATPVIVNSTVSPSVTFADVGPADTHTVIWDYGDGATGNGSVNEGTQTVTGSHTYTKSGVYTLQVTLTDDDNQTATQTFQYVVIYDPSAGFVTGGGNVNSPVGAEPVLPNTTGSASFGISAKYTSTNTVPTGNTMFTFPNGGFDFASTSYDWLVVNGSTAFLHGKGTINGAGNYTFLVSALSGSPDKFRIKITDSSNTVLYDNQMGASETTPPTEAISNGQIKIH